MFESIIHYRSYKEMKQQNGSKRQALKNDLTVAEVLIWFNHLFIDEF